MSNLARPNQTDCTLRA